jgi:phosphate starvation-inducible protein PhoH and related proteins
MGQKNRFVAMDAASPHVNFEVNSLKWTEKQKMFIEEALDKETKIVICEAPPGVGKTILSLYCSLTLLSERKVDQVMYIRNPVESSEDKLGYLKGGFEEKMAPFDAPMVDNLSKLLAVEDNRKLARESQIDSMPLGYLKGRTFDNIALIIDEAEDLSHQQTLLALTRLGKGGKIFLIGDSKQSNVKRSGFARAKEMFDDDIAEEKGIVTLEFGPEDIMRHDLTQFIYNRYTKD